ncbi:hypothetical protein D3C76_1684040 [compost metagenome]
MLVVARRDDLSRHFGGRQCNTGLVYRAVAAPLQLHDLHQARALYGSTRRRRCYCLDLILDAYIQFGFILHHAQGQVHGGSLLGLSCRQG